MLWSWLKGRLDTHGGGGRCKTFVAAAESFTATSECMRRYSSMSPLGRMITDHTAPALKKMSKTGKLSRIPNYNAVAVFEFVKCTVIVMRGRRDSIYVNAGDGTETNVSATHAGY